MENGSIRHRLMLVGAAALFSTGGAAIKMATLDGWQIASVRSLIAAAFLLAAIPETRRGWSPRMAPVAAAYAATLVLFVLANRLTTSANAIFLQSAAPLYLLLLGPFLLHEPIRRKDVLFVLAVAGGVTLFFVGGQDAGATAPDPRRGNLYAAVSGVTYALMLAGMRWLARSGGGGGAIATAALGNVLAGVAVLPLALPVRGFGAGDAAVMSFLGCAQIGLAYLLLTKGIRHVPAVEATTLLMVEPALNPIWSWAIHGETPGRWAIAGGALILSATLYNTLQSASVRRGTIRAKTVDR